jgi:ribonuclease-3 family protein
MDKIMPILTEEEITMFKRGRNTKVNTRAKNASLAEYKKATGFETLIGFLYADGQMERLEFLLKTATELE